MNKVGTAELLVILDWISHDNRPPTLLIKDIQYWVRYCNEFLRTRAQKASGYLDPGVIIIGYFAPAYQKRTITTFLGSIKLSRRLGKSYHPDWSRFGRDGKAHLTKPFVLWTKTRLVQILQIEWSTEHQPTVKTHFRSTCHCCEACVYL